MFFSIFLTLGIVLDLVLISYKERIVKKDIESKVHLVGSFVLNIDNRKGIDSLDRVYNSVFAEHFLSYLVDKDGFEYFMDPYVYGKPDLAEFIKTKYFDYKIYAPSTKYMIVIRIFSTPDDFEFSDLIYSKFLKMNIGEYINEVYTNKVVVANEYIISENIKKDMRRDEQIEDLLSDQVYKFLNQGNQLKDNEYQRLLQFNEYLENLRVRKDAFTKKTKPVLELGAEERVLQEMKVLNQKEKYISINFSDLKYNKFQSRIFKTFPIITLIFVFMALFTILIINILLYKKR